MLDRFGFLLAATLLVAGSAHADGLKPIEAKSFTLGTTTGIVYYTVQPTGYRVVATLQSGETPTVVRFVATLAPEQSVTLSSPRGVGEPAIEVRLVRHGDQLFVGDASQVAGGTTVLQTAAGR
jgi:hypothetical protein